MIIGGASRQKIFSREKIANAHAVFLLGRVFPSPCRLNSFWIYFQNIKPNST
jgi:hypothetical protein